MLDVVYSWLPPKCERCGHLGHKATRCLGLPRARNVKDIATSPFSVPATATCVGTSAFSAPTTDIGVETVETELINLPSGLVMAPAIAKVPATEVTSNTPLSSDIATLEQSSPMDVTITTNTTTSVADQVSIVVPTKVTTTNYEAVPVLAESSVTKATPYCPAVSEIAQVSTTSDKDESSQVPTVHNQESLHLDLSTTLNKEELYVEAMENNRFALLETSDAPERDLVQDVERSRGGRPLKPTQKFQDMRWTIVGGRGNRDRGGRGGRGHTNK